MKLAKIFEKYRHNQLQVIEVSCRVHTESDIDELSYDDFECYLFLNGKKVADISYVLAVAGALLPLVDNVDWHQVFNDAMYERKPQPQLALF